MIVSPEFSYVQARLQARHGERMSEADWRALDGARSLSRYLEQARRTPLRRWSEHLGVSMSSHAIEAALRHEADHAVREVATWMPRDWRAAVRWLAVLPLLPVLAGVLDDEDLPGWATEEPLLAAMVGVEPAGRAAIVARSPLAPLAAAMTDARSLAGLWLDHWKTLWPGGETAEPALSAFTSAVVRNLADPSTAAPSPSPDAVRRGAERICVRYFRNRAATPVAAFAHLGLVLFDLERLRGGVVRRCLFAGATGAEEAA
jgi:hypothetical protein